MGLFEHIMGNDINAGVEEFKNTEGAILLDVRTREEYAEGHIPESINVPVEEIQNVEEVISDHSIPVFVYCLRGGRAANAVKAMKALGYDNARSIGGISKYKGKTVAQ